MNGLEILLKLWGEGDWQKISAALPGTQAMVNQICNDLIKTANDVKRLMMVLQPIVDAADKVKG